MVFLAAAAAQFGRDLQLDLGRVESLVAAARRAGASLLVLPDGTLGGHCTEPRDSGGLLRSQRYLARPETDCEPPDLPPALAADDTIIQNPPSASVRGMGHFRRAYSNASHLRASCSGFHMS